MNVGDHEVRSDTLKELEVSMTGKDESDELKRKPRKDQEQTEKKRNVFFMILDLTSLGLVRVLCR